MNRHLKTFLRKATAIVAAVAIAAGPTARGDVLLSWDFAGKTGSESTVTAGTIDSNLGAGSGVISRGAGLTAATNGDRFNATGWAATSIANAISGNDYMEFSLNFNDTHSFSIDDIAFNWQRSSTGPRELALRSSLDSYAANIQTFTILDNTGTQTFTATLGGATYSGLERDVTFRFYGWAEADTGSGGFEGSGADLVVNGTTALLEVTPTGDPIYWDANGSTAGIGGTGTWAAASALFSTTDAGTDATTRANANPLIFGGTAGTVTVSGGVNADTGITFSTDGYTLSSGTLTLGGADAATNAIVTGADISATIASAITASNGLTKSGAGTLTLSGSNTLGGTTVSGGTLVGTTSSLTGAITNNAAVTFDQAGDGMYASNMDGSGSFTKSGEGNVTLSGTNTYSGGTTVSAGTLTGSTTSLQGGITNNAAVVFNQAADGEYAGAMTGTGSLTKSGVGNVTLSGTNSYSGGTTVSAGTLTGSTTSLQGAITNNAAVVFDQANAGTYAGAMTGTGSLTKSGAGNLTLSGANGYSGGTTVSAGTLTGSTASLQGAITNNAAVVFAQDTNGTYSGAMTGSGSLTKSGTGSVTLSGNNGFSGGTTLSAGTLVAAANTAFGSGTVAASSGTLLAGAGIDVSNTMTLSPVSAINDAWINEFHYDNSGTDVGEFVEVFVGSGFQAGSFNPSLLRIDLYNGNGGASYQNSVESGAVAATSVTGGTMYVWTGMTNGIQNGAPDGLVVSYNGTVVAQGLLSYEGTMTGVGGVANGLASTDVIVFEGDGTAVGQSLQLTGFGSAFNAFTWAGPSAHSPGAVNAGQTIAAGIPITIGSDIGSGTATFSGGITLNGDVSVTATAGGTTEFSGAISGAGGIDKVGAGTVVLSGTNSFAGGTTVSAGTLSVAADAALGDSSGGITLGGGTLELTSGFTLGSGRTITAATGTSSTLAVTSGTVSYGGAFTGSGNLDKAGVGTLSVSNSSNGYSGLFTISAGTLEVTGANAFANATLTQTGGTLVVAPVGGGDVVLPELGGDGGTVAVDSGANAVFSGNSNRSYNGQINGQGGLKKQGSGELTLNGNNGFSGATRVEAGTLKLGVGGSLSGTSEIVIDDGAIFDLTSKNNGLALGNGQRLGGRGTVLGDLEFGNGSQLGFSSSGPLLVGSGTVSFAAGFGIGSIAGLDSSVAEGTYTLLNETTGGSISFANLANVGAGNPFDLGGGKTAYFQQGSLQVVVVPEPSALGLAAAGLALAALGAWRRRAGRIAPAA